MAAKANTASKPQTKSPPPKAIRPPPRKVAPTTATAKPATSKLDQMIAALRKPKGASIFDLMEITGWQMHSVRGAIAGALKKRRELTVTSKKIGETRIYRIEGKA